MTSRSSILLSPLWPLLLVCASVGPADALRGANRMGEWVSWTAMGRVNDVAEFMNVAYVASDGGIGRYDLAYERWRSPLTITDGLRSRRISAIEIDSTANELVYATPAGAAYGFTLIDERDDPFYQTSARMHERLHRPGEWYGYSAPSAVQNPLELMFRSEGILTEAAIRRYLAVDTVIDHWDRAWLPNDPVAGAEALWRSARLAVLPYSLVSDRVHAIGRYGDNFWFAGQRGVSVHNRDLDAWAALDAYVETPAVDGVVRDVAVGSALAWMATDRGLVRLSGIDGTWRTFTTADGLPDTDVRAVAVDTGSVWIATGFGVAQLDRETNRVRDRSAGDQTQRATNDVTVSGGTIWIATDAGVYVSRDNGVTWRRPANLPVIAATRAYVLDAAAGEVWAAGDLGVVGVDIATGAWTEYPLPHHFAGDRSGADGQTEILSLLSDPPLLWVGTDRGVYMVDRSRADYTRHYTVSDGLIDGRVMDIELDEDYIWFATLGGVTRFHWANPHVLR